MLLDIIWLVIGLGLILVGADWLTDGAASMARRFGLSDLIVGLTVVAMGTSAPELVISVISAVNGSPALAVGNVVGSNIFNVLVIIGLVAMIKPIRVTWSVMVGELPVMVFCSLLLLVMILLGNGQVSRLCGWILIALFAIFMIHTVISAKRATGDSSAPQAAATMPIWKSLAAILLGLGGLIYGGDRFVAGASGIAAAIGVGEAIIGLTIVAAGTSLPELATSVVAARKGQPGLAVGNVIGSCIFNILFVLGTSAAIFPLPMGGVTVTDLAVMVASAILFWWQARFGGYRIINRWEGALLFIGYISYTIYLIANV